MLSRATLVEIVPELHYDQNFYYRCLATIGGKSEKSEAYELNVCNLLNELFIVVLNLSLLG